MDPEAAVKEIREIREIINKLQAQARRIYIVEIAVEAKNETHLPDAEEFGGYVNQWLMYGQREVSDPHYRAGVVGLNGEANVEVIGTREG